MTNSDMNRPVLQPSPSGDTYGPMLLRRRSPYTTLTLATLAFAAIALPIVANRAQTTLEWIGVVVAAIPFPIFFAYSIAIRLEIFEKAIRVRKLWGTTVIPLSQLQSVSLPGKDRQKPSNSPARLVIKPRAGRSIHVTVEDFDDDELQAALEVVSKQAGEPPA